MAQIEVYDDFLKYKPGSLARSNAVARARKRKTISVGGAPRMALSSQALQPIRSAQFTDSTHS